MRQAIFKYGKAYLGGAKKPLACWRRRRIDPVTEMPLTQSDSSRTISCAGFLPIGDGSVLRRHVGQFGVGANTVRAPALQGLPPWRGEALLKAAYQAMYGVKQLGRKGVAMTESPEA